MATIRDAIAKLADRLTLTEKEAEEVMREIMAGAATPAQIAAYLMGLRLKGETVEEVAGSVRAMRDHAVRITVGASLIVDTCGTGGDGRHTFNISTTTAFVVSGEISPPFPMCMPPLGGVWGVSSPVRPL